MATLNDHINALKSPLLARAVAAANGAAPAAPGTLVTVREVQELISAMHVCRSYSNFNVHDIGVTISGYNVTLTVAAMALHAYKLVLTLTTGKPHASVTDPDAPLGPIHVTAPPPHPDARWDPLIAELGTENVMALKGAKLTEVTAEALLSQGYTQLSDLQVGQGGGRGRCGSGTRGETEMGEAACRY